MKTSIRINSVAAAALTTAAFVLAGCGGGGSSSSTPQQPAAPLGSSYTGPGSKWDVDLGGDGSFTIERRDTVSSPVDLTVNGTYETLPTGFLRMTVSDAAGTDAPSAGDAAWAVEIPDYALFLKTDDSDSGDFIAMVEAGSCPTTDFLGNWVMVKNRADADATDPDQDYFGSFAYDASASGATLPGRYSLTDGFPSLGGQDLRGGTCEDGIMLVDDAAMYLTANGGALVHTNQSNDDEANIIFAMPQQPFTAVSDLDGELIGIMFDQNPSAANDAVMAVTASCTAGLCQGALIDDVRTGDSVATFSINLTGTLDQPTPGFITGTILSENEEGNIACVVNTDLGTSGTNLVSCVGQAPGDNTGMFNLILKG